MKVLALLFVGTGALAYSCSGDDIFEEEEDARSLAKRAMQRVGEEPDDKDEPSSPVYKIMAGEETVKSHDGNLSIRVEWKEGNLGRGSDPALSFTVSGINGLDLKVAFPSAKWNSSSTSIVHIAGSVLYKYYEIVDWRYDENGNLSPVKKERTASTSFDVDVVAELVEDDKWKPGV